jgi:hypothetical protein
MPEMTHAARQLWHRVEMVNAVTYFSPECRAAPEALGLKGFWMGYFACRAAPLGPAPAAVVEATFFNFHPARVERAIPDAWRLADPDDVIVARARAAAAALRRLLPDADGIAAATAPMLDAAIARGTAAGRPLFAANRAVSKPDDPVAALWQAATTLREHRGDTHVALLACAELDGCEVHALFAADEGVAADLYLQSRGWSADDWDAGVNRLAARGLVTGDGGITPAGRQLRSDIEQRTDELAISPYRALGDAGVAELLERLAPAATRIASAGEITFPNPMGLPPPA